MFNALRHRNFRLYLSGQFVSLIGTWMQQLATSWMVYRLTHSPLWLGISMFSSQIPMFIFGWMSGVLVDRANKRRLLVWTQSLSAIQALALAALTLTGRINLTELIGLNLVLGCINAVDMPARQAFVIQMIAKKDDLANAIALNSSVMNGTRLIGPAIAGFTIAAFGEGPCFLLNALSYIAVIIALMAMQIEREPRLGQEENFFESLRTGLHAAFDDPPIRVMLIYLAYVSLMGLPYNTLFPALATRVDGGGANALGGITAAAGLGALTGAMYLARRRNVEGLGRVAGRATVAFSLGLIAIAWSTPFVLTLLCIFVTGLSMMLLLASGNTVIQTLVEDDKRGRVMAFFSFALLGTAPFGSLFMGWLAQRIGIPWALTFCGGMCLMGGLGYVLRTPRLNGYVEKDLGRAVAVF